MRNRIFLLASIAALIIGATIFALGQGEAVMAHFQHQGHGGRPAFGPEMVDHVAGELNLTEAQKKELKALLETAQTNLAPLQQKMDQVHKQLEAATANGQFDEAQVRALATQEAQLMAETIVEHHRTKSKAYSMLTPEQRVKADELHKRHGRHQRNSGSHGAMSHQF
jgi:periplasmic protein CpxP/Spy